MQITRFARWQVEGHGEYTCVAVDGDVGRGTIELAAATALARGDHLIAVVSADPEQLASAELIHRFRWTGTVLRVVGRVPCGEVRSEWTLLDAASRESWACDINPRFESVIRLPVDDAGVFFVSVGTGPTEPELDLIRRAGGPRSAGGFVVFEGDSRDPIRAEGVSLARLEELCALAEEWCVE